MKPRTLRCWVKKAEGQPRDLWLPILAPSYVGTGREAECDPAAWDFIKADYLRLEKPPFASCYRRLQRAAEAHGWTIPTEKTLLRRTESKIQRPVRVLMREGEDRFKRTYPAQIRDRAALRSLEVVNADGHRFDVFVRWPDGEIGRPVLVAWQDIRSGKLLAWRIDRTENTDVVRLSFGDLIADHGIPEHAVLDNGRGFASKHMTGGVPNRYRFKVKDEEPEGILKALGVAVHWGTPYHGQAKPIERAFLDLCSDVAKHSEFAGAYTGNKPDAKPDNYSSRAVPIERFIEVLSSEINAHNARQGRRGGICNGRSFDEVFAESYGKGPIRKTTATQRRMCLLAAEQVRADRETGAVYLNVEKRNRYWDEALSNHAGERLIVRFDPDRLHDSVHVYSRDNHYLCEARCTHAAGFLDSQAAREHQRDRNKWRKAAKKQAAAEIRMSTREAAALVPPVGDPEPPDAKVIKGRFRTPQRPAATAQRRGNAEDPDIKKLLDNGATIRDDRRVEHGEDTDDWLEDLLSRRTERR